MRSNVWQIGWRVKVMWVLVHTVGVGGLLFLDSNLYRNTVAYSWWAGSYYVLLLVVVIQYCCTAGSSPGYLVDMLSEDAEYEIRAKAAVHGNSRASQSVVEKGCSSYGSFNSSESTRTASRILTENGKGGHPSVSETSPLLMNSANVKRESDGRHSVRAPNSLSLVCNADRCLYCQHWQPLRVKHCHDCDKCVLRFDHHCVSLGTCVGQRNHRKFWWYIFYETVLVMWTIVRYISAFGRNTGSSSLLEKIAVLVLIIGLISTECFLVTLLLFHSFLILTNQTTYETTRRHRIPYLRTLPENVHPFSKGMDANLSSFCCSPSSEYPIYVLPSREELQNMVHPLCCFQL
ncbi:protein S-acyltransferase 10 isoform X1 [Physcomitrium patens]|uniref:S-acyltransferase n=1 Tax=Physcomitrium patens TaxID=3218 RepID=A0A2K1L8D6_PHYPA|nr:protein S-acyltransferase 10-like [Physcomitrium patens]PNR62293.1 hypothetical protein PHYPA_000717 [Physcomitrium patens]|eukprot:XP_024370730.1 protein S-acyltransferase 10-like [Physcomitrella patens]